MISAGTFKRVMDTSPAIDSLKIEIIMFGENILVIEELIILLLLIASVVAIISRQLRIPYTVGLVLIGLALTLLIKIEFEISPQIILALLVPPLVFEAAFHIRFDDLRRDFWLILVLAIPGVILTTLLVGGMVAWGTGLALPIAMVFGALVSATDPVAVWREGHAKASLREIEKALDEHIMKLRAQVLEDSAQWSEMREWSQVRLFQSVRIARQPWSFG